VATALLACLCAPVALTASANASSVQTLQQQAAHIVAEINANGNRISDLDEQINDARIHLTSLKAQIHRTQLQIASAQHTVDHLHGAVVARATALYRGVGGTTLMPQTASSVEQQGAMNVYSEAAASQDQQRIDKYRDARDASTRAKAKLDAAERSQQAQLSSLEASEDQIVKLNAKEHSLLNQKNAQLQQAIVAQQQAEAAAAQRAAAAKARAAAAQAAAATHRRSHHSSLGTSSDASFGPIPLPASGAARAVAVAENQIGSPYQWGADGPGSFDCSGLTKFAWAAAGVSLVHSSAGQYASLPHIPIGDAQPGDLVFFGHPIHHVGMVIGGGMMVEAPFTGADVREASYITRGDLVGAARP
jgi:cell wall-associated NlpC family hydrolase